MKRREGILVKRGVWCKEEDKEERVSHFDLMSLTLCRNDQYWCNDKTRQKYFVHATPGKGPVPRISLQLSGLYSPTVPWLVAANITAAPALCNLRCWLRRHASPISFHSLISPHPSLIRCEGVVYLLYLITFFYQKTTKFW